MKQPTVDDLRAARKPRRATPARRPAPRTPRPLVGRSTRAQIEALPLPSGFGMYVCSDIPHPFMPLDMTSCKGCFGWRDDPRHT